MSYIFELIDKIIAIYGIVLILIGTIANTLSFLVCLKVKNNNTFIFLATMSVTNIFAIFYWNMEHILSILFNINWTEYSLLVCKLGNYLQYTSLGCSVWILVTID